MRRFTAFVALVLLTFAVSCGKKDSQSTPPPEKNPIPGGPSPVAGSDKDRFQGVWKAESTDSGNGAKEPKGDRAPRLQVEGDRASLRESSTDSGEQFAAVWDETKNPKTLTLTPSGADGKPFPSAVQVWIYKFEGDTLVVAFGFGPTPPTEFKGDELAGVMLMRFKKTDEKPVATSKTTGAHATNR